MDGFAVAHGMPDLRVLPLERFSNFVWYMLTRNARSEAEVGKMKAKLWQPPAGEKPDPRSPWSPENEMRAFAALKAQLSK